MSCQHYPLTTSEEKSKIYPYNDAKNVSSSVFPTLVCQVHQHVIPALLPPRQVSDEQALPLRLLHQIVGQYVPVRRTPGNSGATKLKCFCETPLSITGACTRRRSASVRSAAEARVSGPRRRSPRSTSRTTPSSSGPIFGQRLYLPSSGRASRHKIQCAFFTNILRICKHLQIVLIRNCLLDLLRNNDASTDSR